ncbi:MAG: hypothetical protein OXG55_13840 [bacterium]|nr:hypothetical protein [bacterium]
MHDVAVVAGIVAQAVPQSRFDVGHSDPALLQPLTCMIRDDEALAKASHLKRRK